MYQKIDSELMWKKLEKKQYRNVEAHIHLNYDLIFQNNVSSSCLCCTLFQQRANDTWHQYWYLIPFNVNGISEILCFM